MNTGVVKFFNEEKGFGFIKPDDGSKDVFVHKKNLCERTICDDDRVEYELEKTEKGFSANNVKRSE